MTHRGPPTQQKEARVGTDHPGEGTGSGHGVSAGRGSLSLAFVLPRPPIPPQRPQNGGIYFTPRTPVPVIFWSILMPIPPMRKFGDGEE